ncbi:MAG: hypothetical protein ACM3TN_22805 [Alphaproteobacteria bacterium]
MDAQQRIVEYQNVMDVETPSLERCTNRFCDSTAKRSPRGKCGRFCFNRCRMDAYMLRRAKDLLAMVGIVRFHQLMDGL